MTNLKHHHYRGQNNPLKLEQVEQFCRAMHFEAHISGDDMLAFIYDSVSGLWLGVIAIC